MAVLKNAKHEAVALAYLADPEKIGWRAYKKVYPKSSQHAAETAFSRLLNNVEFAARVAETHEAAATSAVMSATEVLERLTTLGRGNVLDFMRITKDGDPAIDFSEITRAKAEALVEVTTEDFTDGRGDDARDVKRIKFRLADKRGALDLLGKHHALFTERHLREFGGVADRLAAALLRTDGKKHGKVGSDRHPPRAGHAAKGARKGQRARA
jgi:phage terminase small subunit